jgi:hypothetical protein
MISVEIEETPPVLAIPSLKAASADWALAPSGQYVITLNSSRGRPIWLRQIP